jgi:hypothetical protein
MFKKIVLLVLTIYFSGLQAQENNSLYKTKKIRYSLDSIQIEKESLNSDFFKLLDSDNQVIDSTFYQINFPKATLYFNKTFTTKSDSLTVQYLKFPDILTKEYHIYDPSQVVSNDISSEKLYQVQPKTVNTNVPFDGLTTSGSITRGITIGNNQNGVLNSNLDLQITGKLSDKVSLRASLQDSNIPLQDGGYSQK